MSFITKVVGREVLDSRGNPTVQAHVWTANGGYGVATAPSGASTGAAEAVELRDGSVANLSQAVKNRWYGQKGVSVAVKNINEKIAPAIINQKVTNQVYIDQLMRNLDGTHNKSSLGANAVVSVSMAVARAAAVELHIPLYKYIGGVNARVLPVPMLNVINGGAHASNTLDFQEFMIVPAGFSSFKESLQTANKVFHTLAKILKGKGFGTQVGDEGGFAPNIPSHAEALELLVQAIKQAGYTPGTSGKNTVAIAIDAAASEFYDTKTKLYTFKKALAKNLVTTSGAGDKQGVFTTHGLATYWAKLVSKYPIISIEDPFSETDWDGFVMLTKTLGKNIQVVGDDLFVTNPKILAKGIALKAANSVLIKLNQIGTVTETITAIQMAAQSCYTAVVSHRSGESCDTTIADLAVGCNTGQIKTGSLSRAERIAKYNRLLAIEEELGTTAKYYGWKSFYNIHKPK